MSADPSAATLEARWAALGAGEALFHALGAGDVPRVRDLLPRSDVRLAPLIEHAADCDQAAALRWLLGAEASQLLPPAGAVPRVSEHRRLSDLVFAHAAVCRLCARLPAPELLAPELLASVIRLTLDEVRAAVLASPTLTDECNWLGHTLLHPAAASGSPEAVALLLDVGFDPRAGDVMRHTPLTAVANRIPTPTEDGVAAAALLIRAGADVNARSGAEDLTPLHAAARRGNVPLGRLLISHGAAVNARTTKGDTPLARARNCRQTAFATLLEAHGAG